MIILLIEWFIKHPALRYGGYSLIAIIFFVPFSLIFEKYKTKIYSIKKKTFIIILIGITIFTLRNFDRLIKENKKYNYNVLINPYYKVDDSYFYIENKIYDLISNYKLCKKDKTKCNQDGHFILKKMNKHILIKNR